MESKEQMGRPVSDGYLFSCKTCKTFLSRRSFSFCFAGEAVTGSLELFCIDGVAGFLSARKEILNQKTKGCVCFVHNIKAQWCKYENIIVLLQVLTHTGIKPS